MGGTSDGSIRICGDYKQTTNSVARADAYPLPRVEDILASLAGGKSFSKLDLAHAYQQLVLDEESKKYTTINTEKGLYQYRPLAVGVVNDVMIAWRPYWWTCDTPDSERWCFVL